MARYINIKETDFNSIKEQALLDFEIMLNKLAETPDKLLDTISFREKYTLGPTNIQKQTVFITASAYLKMLTYVLKSEKEIAWHGTVLTDFEKYPNKYFITNAFLYPQLVSGATVTTDQTKYNNWTMELEDEVFNSMRLQGHSHVNFAVSPSSVDTTFYEELVQNLHNGEFYIFMIMNKKQELYFRIYDTANNIMYDKEDIIITIIGEDNEDFLSDISIELKEHITDRTFQFANTKNTAKTHYLDGKMVTADEYYAAMEEENTSLFDYYTNRDMYNAYPSKKKEKKHESKQK